MFICLTTCFISINIAYARTYLMISAFRMTVDKFVYVPYAAVTRIYFGIVSKFVGFTFVY